MKHMVNQNKRLNSLLLIDEIVLFISIIIAYHIYLGDPSKLFNQLAYRNLLFICLLMNILVSNYIGSNDNLLKGPLLMQVGKLVKVLILDILSVSCFLFITKQSELVSRVVTLLGFFIFFIISFIVRFIYIKSNKNRVINKDARRVFIITTSSDVDNVVSNINNYNYDSYKIDGICVLDKDLKGTKIDKYKVRANKDDVISYICRSWVDEVFIATNRNNVPSNIFNDLSKTGITVSILINDFDQFIGREHSINELFNETVSTFSIKNRSQSEVVLKRLMDITGGLVGSLITIILTIFIGPIIYIKSPGPIFYKQERIGLNGKKFYMYKFRSMVTNADELKKDLLKDNRYKDGMMFKIKDDPRIIPGIGTFIRKTSLDEFPQFFNVVKGDMSLVGTRPPTVDEWVKYKLEHRIRMTIKPGITGMWQVNGRSKVTDFDKVIEYDTKYINNWSLGLDIYILFKTIYVLLFVKREDDAM